MNITVRSNLIGRHAKLSDGTTLEIVSDPVISEQGESSVLAIDSRTGRLGYRIVTHLIIEKARCE